MIRKTLLSLLVLLLLGAGIEYTSAPLFWQRYLGMFSSAGQGAYAPVFDYTVDIPAAETVSALPLPVTTSIDPEALQAMADYAAKFDSFALLVLHRGAVQLEWYREDYGPDSLTQSQSMHKSLQALLVGIAVDEGLIADIDDPIGNYLPELAGDERGETTIRDYLVMASGIKPFAGGFSPFGEAFRWLYAEDINAATLAIPRVSPPGERFDYHDAATQTLGMLLTRVFGKPYAEYLYDRVWNPMGGEPAKIWLDRPGGNPHHNCCLLARAADWARLGLLFQNGGKVNGQRLVSEDWVQQQTSPKLTPHYGFQTWLGSNEVSNDRPSPGYRRYEDWLAEDVFYFSGYGAQRVYVSPSKQVVIVRLGPAAGYFPKIAEEWDNAFLFNTAVRGIIE